MLRTMRRTVTRLQVTVKRVVMQWCDSNIISGGTILLVLNYFHVGFLISYKMQFCFCNKWLNTIPPCSLSTTVMPKSIHNPTVTCWDNAENVELLKGLTEFFLFFTRFPWFIRVFIMSIFQGFHIDISLPSYEEFSCHHRMW